MFKNLLKLFRYRGNALVLPRSSGGVNGCYVAAIITKNDGVVWAVEKNLNAAFELQQSDWYAKNHTIIKWMALMPDPSSHTWGQ
jgi:hypothetical protein